MLVVHASNNASQALSHMWGAFRVLVYWGGDGAHYPAVIDDYDDGDRYHLIYDDGSLPRGCLLASASWMFARVRAAGPAPEPPCRGPAPCRRGLPDPGLAWPALDAMPRLAVLRAACLELLRRLAP